MKDKLKYAFYLLLPLIGGSIIGFLTRDYIDYTELIQPPLAPPSLLFPIVWTIIYLLLGIAYFLYRKKYEESSTIKLYYLQLIFNFLWSIIFFIYKNRLLAVFWILILDILVILLFRAFLKKEKISAYLVIPYLLWLLFATYLTIGIYILN